MGLFSFLFGKKDNSALVEAMNKGAYLVDVRTSIEFSGGSVKGAVNIPLSDLRRQMKKFKGKKNIVVFCRSGARSGQAKRILEQNGFGNVINGGSVRNVEKLL